MFKITVKPAEKTDFIWNRRPPFLVVYKYNKDVIVLVNENNDKSDLFGGMSILTGYFSTNWAKKNFEEYKGSVTIESN